jgi:hypothetical protein
MPVHPFYPPVEELLSPEALSAVTGTTIGRANTLPFDTVDGRSGGALLAVETNDGAGPRLVLKRISWEIDMTMRVTNDHAGRAVTNWQGGLPDRLPRQITHGVVGCARDGAGWAILLEDFRGNMLPPDEQRLTAAQDDSVLSAMAAMHAAYWEEPSTTTETFGLCTMCTRYESIFPPAMLRERNSGLPLVPYILEGWELFHDIVDQDVADLVQSLHADVGPLYTALEMYPHTLLHGDWHHGNLGIDVRSDSRVILLDWTLISLGPPATDLAEYMCVGVMRLPGSKEDTIERYRRLLALQLGDRFDDPWWLPQLELALLGEFLRLGFDKAQTAVHGTSEAVRQRERAEISWWCDYARRATRWL